MPHDFSGKLVTEGQTVLVPFVVKSVSANDEACNCTLETVRPLYPYAYGSALVVNTKQVDVVE